jgi:L-galactose dehydrogenase
MRYNLLGGTGMRVSALGFGASSLGAVFRPVTLDACIETVHAALDGGINFIDVAPLYGDTLAETNLGRALQGIARDRYYLATKVGSYNEARHHYDFSRATTERSVEHSLRRLGVDTIDLIQCHDIEFADHDQIVEDPARAASAEGAGPRPPRRHHRPAARHLSFPHRPGRARHRRDGPLLLPLHAERRLPRRRHPLPPGKGIGIINAAPTGMGLLSPRPLPAWHPASPAIVAGCRQAVAHCQAKGADIVKLAVQFACSHPAIATTCVGTADPAEIRRNIACLDAPIDEKLLAEVRAILAPIHNHNFTRGLPQHRDPILGDPSHASV